MCCYNLLSLWDTTETAEVRNNPLRNQTLASEFCSAGSGVKIIIWLHPKLTPQKKFHKPGRHYQDKVNAAWRTVPSGVVGCTACPPTTPGKENILHLFPRLIPGLGTSLQHPFQGYHCVSQPPFLMSLCPGKSQDLNRTSSTPSWDGISAVSHVFLHPLHWFSEAFFFLRAER